MTEDKRISILEKKLSRIEKCLGVKNESNPTNEVAPIIAKAIPIILKNLPLILSVLPELIKVLETDQVNDNTEKIDVLNQLKDIGTKVAELFKSN